MTREDKIKCIREEIEKNEYPLETFPKRGYATNCLAYALGISFKEPEDKSKEYIFNLGVISQKAPPRNIKEAEEAFMADMKELGLFCKKTSYEAMPSKGEQKVVLFLDDFFKDDDIHDFHMMRQDENGLWSYQNGINTGEVIVFGGDPQNDVEYGWYALVGYYILTKN